MQTYKTLSSVIRSVITESHKKDDPPFEPDEKSSFKKANNKNRTGMDAAKALARRAMQKKMKESFDLDISDEEADDLLNSIQEGKEGAPHQSEYMRTYSFSPEEHRQEGDSHLEDAKKHRDAGNMIKFRRSMIKHHESMITADLKDEKEKNNNRS